MRKNRIVTALTVQLIASFFVPFSAHANLLPSSNLPAYSQNSIMFYNPNDCNASTSKSSLIATGEFADIMNAKNAEKSFFNGSGDVPSPRWGDGNKESMRQLLETYGDLAYRLGKVVGAPYVAILVQMRYEDPDSACGKNNFWGNGCPQGTGIGGASIKAENLGEGFIQYGKTLTNGLHDQALGISDPKEYLESIGPTWVQGDINGPGYDSIDGMRMSVDSLQAYIDSSEGQAIVKEFGGDGGPSDNSTTVSRTSRSGCNTDGGKVVAAVEDIINLANQNGSTYTAGGGHSDNASDYDNMLNGSPVNVDCTGFSTLVMYKAFGVVAPHSSASIIAGNDSDKYEEIPRSEVAPGDIFAFKSSESWSGGHGGVVVEVENGNITKVAEAGLSGGEGSSGNNTNIGYTTNDFYSLKYLNDGSGHFYRLKGVDYGGVVCAGDIVCGGASGSADGMGLVAGGMTKEQAEAFIKEYVDEAMKQKTGNYGRGQSNDIAAIGKGFINDASCPYGTLNNCVAMSQWFVNNYTTVDYRGTDNGVNYASYLISLGGFIDGGNTPKAYSIFSKPGPSAAGHTGVVLGVDTEKGEVYTAEAHCHLNLPFAPPQVKVYSIDEMSSGLYNFAYTDNVLKLGGV